MDPRHVQTVRFVNFDEPTTSIFTAVFQSLHGSLTVGMAEDQTLGQRRMTGDEKVVDASGSHHFTQPQKTSASEEDKANEQLKTSAADCPKLAVDLSPVPASGTTSAAAAQLASFTGSTSFSTTSSHAVMPTSSDPYKMLTSCGIDVWIYYGNLTDEKVDAIVNPANSLLIHGGGAARAIAQAAGRQLDDECRSYIRQYRELKVTQPMHTTAGRLNPPVLYVIHVAGPSAAQFPNPSDLYKAVFDTFYHCLLYANNFLHVSSLSIPAVSSGE